MLRVRIEQMSMLAVGTRRRRERGGGLVVVRSNACMLAVAAARMQMRLRGCQLMSELDLLFLLLLLQHDCRFLLRRDDECCGVDACGAFDRRGCLTAAAATAAAATGRWHGDGDRQRHRCAVAPHLLVLLAMLVVRVDIDEGGSPLHTEEEEAQGRSESSAWDSGSAPRVLPLHSHSKQSKEKSSKEDGVQSG